ncbi:hypothetical protein CVT24_002886 [Panaeolus cyanescens]|uniref:Uncharacterized protein n=1 Tax=Panaeolus cyanescens TaxID=181874 RepID=A0A409YXX8_9AGAR|nr:hypothetical protein CVT24_002886 [Panaeolus cyanescens]
MSLTKKDSPPASPPQAEHVSSFIEEQYSQQALSLKDVQTQMVIYGNTLYDNVASSFNPFSDPEGSQRHPPIQLPEDPPPDLTAAAENVARALDELADAHPSDKAKKEYRNKAKKFRKLGQLPKEKQRGVFRQVGHGFFLILIAPVALAGMTIYVTGVMLEGTGMILKSVGYHGKRLFRLERGYD